jgi:hypothetical protein
MPDGLTFRPSPRLVRYAKRGGARSVASLCRVESDVVTLAQIAERVGCTVSQARHRVQRERTNKRRLTWEGLGR